MEFHRGTLHQTLLPYFPVTGRTIGVEGSSAEASLCRSRRREVGERKQKRARVDGKRKKTDPALIVFFQLFLFSLQYAAGVSLEERGFPLYPSLR